MMPPWLCPGRPGIALAQPESADETAALLVIGKAQAHAVGIILATGEAVVLLQLYVARVVSSFGVSSLGLLASHRKILSRAGIGAVDEQLVERRASRPSFRTQADATTRISRAPRLL